MSLPLPRGLVKIIASPTINIEIRSKSLSFNYYSFFHLFKNYLQNLFSIFITINHKTYLQCQYKILKKSKKNFKLYKNIKLENKLAHIKKNHCLRYVDIKKNVVDKLCAIFYQVRINTILYKNRFEIFNLRIILT